MEFFYSVYVVYSPFVRVMGTCLPVMSAPQQDTFVSIKYTMLFFFFLKSALLQVFNFEMVLAKYMLDLIIRNVELEMPLVKWQPDSMMRLESVLPVRIGCVTYSLQILLSLPVTSHTGHPGKSKAYANQGVIFVSSDQNMVLTSDKKKKKRDVKLSLTSELFKLTLLCPEEVILLNQSLDDLLSPCSFKKYAM